jgi:hypothetical protein
MEPIEKKEPLYLVVAQRENAYKNQFPYAQLWKENKTDPTYRTAYKGKAITLDTRRCTIPDCAHIIGDPQTFHFERFIIKAAYFDEMPTFKAMDLEKVALTPPGSGHVFKRVKSYQNLLGDCVKNTRKYMAPDSRIEIEWHPSIGIYIDDVTTVESVFPEHDTLLSPFSGFINAGLMQAAIQMLYDKEIPEEIAINLPEAFLECARSLSKTFKQIITFYAQQGIGTEELLIERIKREFWLWNELDEKNALVALTHGPSASLEDFSQAVVRCSIFPKQSADLVLGNGCQFHEQLTALFGHEKFLVFDANGIFNDSLFACMLSDAVVIHNTPYVKEFMEKSGFKNVTVKRTTSKRNGRENVWIVRGNFNEFSA